jgi:hypothetical protein
VTLKRREIIENRKKTKKSYKYEVRSTKEKQESGFKGKDIRKSYRMLI